MADETRTDSDQDGLSDAVERKLGLNIHDADSDGDGLIDGFEVAVGQARVRDLGIKDPQGSAQIVDELVENLEQQLGVAHNVDTDGDGFADWVEEMRSESDPKVADLDPAQVLNNPDPLEEFMNRAQSQMGAKYRFGAEVDLDDGLGADAFDSSELVQWAAHQAGVEMPDGSWKQYQALHSAGTTMSVEAALETKGALLFGFSSDPLTATDRPARAYVAISLGNGKVLDISERGGELREMDPGNFFTHAGSIPEFTPSGTTDTDGDGHPDIEEDLIGGDPTTGNTTPWRDTWNIDTDGDGLSDAEDPEPEIPASPSDAEPSDARPSDAQPDAGPSEPDEWRLPDAPTFEPFNDEPFNESVYASSDDDAPYDAGEDTFETFEG